MAEQSAATAVALAQYRRQQRIVRRTANRAQTLWRRVDAADLEESWRQIAPLLVSSLAQGQEEAAATAEDYLAAVITAEGGVSRPEGRVTPSAFSVSAADGRPLVSLLYQPVIDWRVRLAAGQSAQDAARGSLRSLLQIVGTEVADAGRSATGAGIAANRTINGYLRVVQPPACARCVILAGKEFGWNSGFQRHPRCDCIHLPAVLIARGRARRGSLSADRFSPTTRPGTGPRGFLDSRAYFNGLTRAEQNKIFTRAGAQAIRDGASMSSVVNARRGMYTASAYRRTVAATREGTTRRGLFRRLELERTQARTGVRFARDRTEARQGLQNGRAHV